MSNANRKSFGYEMADPVVYELLKEFANENRKNPTATESILWDFLKGKRTGYKFRRQHIIGDYIADFICLEHNLIIEIDGRYHQLPTQQMKDEDRTKWLESKGFKVIRFTNEEVTGDIEAVMKKIRKFIINGQL